MEKRFPYIKWYARDWRGDGALRMCSFAARGLWADILSIIHDEGAPYGQLRINGAVPRSDQLARMTGGSAREIDRLFAELETAGVFSRTDDGVIYSRRMVRDKAKYDADRDNGKGGGNPNLRNQDKASDKRGVNPQDKAQSQSPEPLPKKNNKSESRESAPQAAAPPSVPETTIAKPPKPARGTRWSSEMGVSEDWLVDAEMSRTEHALPAIDLRLEAAKFKNYWASKSGGSATKVDWKLTWMNWALKAEEPRKTNGNARQESQITQFARVAAGLIRDAENACDDGTDLGAIGGAEDGHGDGGDDTGRDAGFSASVARRPSG